MKKTNADLFQGISTGLMIMGLFFLLKGVIAHSTVKYEEMADYNDKVSSKEETVEPLRVSDDGRWFIYSDGSPFFYLGDTAWELFHRLNREEANRYLTDRVSKGFTVIQAVVLAEHGGLDTPNPYGHTPLIDNNPSRPNEEYFRHVDYIVERAEELGLFIGMLPTWGDKFNKKWGSGPEIFTPANAQKFGKFLGNRYKNNRIIWILGGDRIPEEEEHFEIIRSMAKGIRTSVGNRQLMTYHPWGGSGSYEWFHNDDWLDFNMFQSGHAKFDIPNYEFTLEGYNSSPTKPVLDGEPRYEDHPVNWNPDEGWFTDFDVRQAAWWSMLAGAAGHTYGNHNIWQMWQPDRNPISSARTPWQDALNHIGAAQMGYMRSLFESRPYQRLVPDQSVIVGDKGTGPAYIRAACASDASFLFVYTPYGKSFTVDITRISGNRAKAWWFNPRTGVTDKIGSIQQTDHHLFDPPGKEKRGNDWVLVLDSVQFGFGEL